MAETGELVRRRLLRVVVVDDHERMRWAVGQLLNVAGCVVVGEAADGPSGVAVTLELAPDVLVVDWRLPGLDGLAVAARVRAALPGVRVVLFTAEPPPGMPSGGMPSGGGSLPVDRTPAEPTNTGGQGTSWPPGAQAVDVVVAKGSMPQELLRAVTDR